MFTSFRTFWLLFCFFLSFILFEIFSFLHKILLHLNTFKNLQTVYPTHPTLNLCCIHIVSAIDFIQTLNKTEDFELFFLYSRFCYLLPFLRYRSFSFMLFLPLFRFYNGCVLRNPLQARVGDVISRMEKQ